MEYRAHIADSALSRAGGAGEGSEERKENERKKGAQLMSSRRPFFSLLSLPQVRKALEGARGAFHSCCGAGRAHLEAAKRLLSSLELGVPDAMTRERERERNEERRQRAEKCAKAYGCRLLRQRRKRAREGESERRRDGRG